MFGQRLVLLFSLGLLVLLPRQAWTQGETTSAIVGQVTDSTGAALPKANVTVASLDSGLERTALTDSAGRFNFPQLKPGRYSIAIEAQGFAPQKLELSAALGQKQTVNFSLKLAQSSQIVVVTGEAPLINPANSNTSTTLSAPALENLPNPGEDLTYPLQFAPGALINTAGERQ